MPIVYVGYVRRQDVSKYRGRLYVFGDNEMRLGAGGQASEMRGEFNAIGIRMKARPDKKAGAWWTDEDFHRVAPLILDDMLPIMLALKEGREVVLPIAGLGTGEARLPVRAPRIYAFLCRCLEIAKTYGAVSKPKYEMLGIRGFVPNL